MVSPASSGVSEVKQCLSIPWYTTRYTGWGVRGQAGVNTFLNIVQRRANRGWMTCQQAWWSSRGSNIWLKSLEMCLIPKATAVKLLYCFGLCPLSVSHLSCWWQWTNLLDLPVCHSTLPGGFEALTPTFNLHYTYYRNSRASYILLHTAWHTIKLQYSSPSCCHSKRPHYVISSVGT